MSSRVLKVMSSDTQTGTGLSRFRAGENSYRWATLSAASSRASYPEDVWIRVFTTLPVSSMKNQTFVVPPMPESR